MYTLFETMNSEIYFFSSDSDPGVWATSGFLRDKWSSEDEELAGPSQTVPPQLHGMTSSSFYYHILEEAIFQRYEPRNF